MQYKKLNGTYTNDINEYLDSWRIIGDELAKALGGRLMAFNPDFQIDFKTYTESFSVRTATKICELHKSSQSIKED
jgi:hypothetical protein